VVETPSLTIAAGKDAAVELAGMPASRRPSAVFCANDLVALGVLQGLNRNGIEVPRDVALVGYDDIDFASAATVPLSSIRQPREQLGRRAAELMFDEVALGPAHKHRQVVFEPHLVVRDSSALRRRRRGSTRTPAVEAAIMET
jgi:LacI family transcriptional regulator